MRKEKLWRNKIQFRGEIPDLKLYHESVKFEQVIEKLIATERNLNTPSKHCVLKLQMYVRLKIK